MPSVQQEPSPPAPRVGDSVFDAEHGPFGPFGEITEIAFGEVTIMWPDAVRHGYDVRQFCPALTFLGRVIRWGVN